jgi:hypothetical protein
MPTEFGVYVTVGGCGLRSQSLPPAHLLAGGVGNTSRCFSLRHVRADAPPQHGRRIVQIGQAASTGGLAHEPPRLPTVLLGDQQPVVRCWPLLPTPAVNAVHRAIARLADRLLRRLRRSER